MSPAGPALPVAVVVATRDRPGPLGRLLASLAAQAPPPAEVVVLDNAGAAPLDAAALGARVPGVPLRVVRTDAARSVAAARATLLAEATAPVVLVLDDDAYLPERGTVGAVGAHFAADARLGALALALEDHRQAPPVWLSPLGTRRTRPAGPTRRVGYFVGGAHALRAAAAAEAGGYDPAFPYGEEELDLSYRLVAAGHALGFDPALWAVHHPDSAPVPSAAARAARLRGRLRNRIVLAVRYLPMPYAAAFLAVWLSRHAVDAARAGLGQAFADGLRDGVRAAQQAGRTPLPPAAVRYLRHHGGRLWY